MRIVFALHNVTTLAQWHNVVVVTSEDASNERKMQGYGKLNTLDDKSLKKKISRLHHICIDHYMVRIDLYSSTADCPTRFC